MRDFYQYLSFFFHSHHFESPSFVVVNPNLYFKNTSSYNMFTSYPILRTANCYRQFARLLAFILCWVSNLFSGEIGYVKNHDRCDPRNWRLNKFGNALLPQ
jgi:hypothetical protein